LFAAALLLWFLAKWQLFRARKWSMKKAIFAIRNAEAKPDLQVKCQGAHER
jgi:hypothetical protein